MIHSSRDIKDALQHCYVPFKPPIVWSIAGSDSGGGAGIQADTKAFHAFGVHGCTAIAAITAQNSQKVQQIIAVSAEQLDAQIAALAKDLPPRAIKTGMLATVENVLVVARWVDKLRQENPDQPIALVVDPIYSASTGVVFADEDLRQAIIHELLPRTTLLKPNLKEAYWLTSGINAWNEDATTDSIPLLAQQLKSFGAKAVVITGGDAQNIKGKSFSLREDCSYDWMDTPEVKGWLSLPREGASTTHGTGCTFTASAATALSLDFCLADAIILAKMATTSAIQNGYTAGKGAGPVHLQAGFALQPKLLPQLKIDAIMSMGLDANPFAPLKEDCLGIYPIVESSVWVKKVIDAGAKTVQLRVKSTKDKNFLAREIKQSIQYAQKVGKAGKVEGVGVQFFVNDHWELALELGAYGIHLGQDDLKTADLKAIKKAGIRLGVSTYTIWEVCQARALMPSYYACGPVYKTHSKELPYHAQGEANLAYWCHMLDKPVVAIGGIDIARSEQVARCGAQGLAVISAVTQATDPIQAVQALMAGMEKGRHMPRVAAPALPRTIMVQSDNCAHKK